MDAEWRVSYTGRRAMKYLNRVEAAVRREGLGDDITVSGGYSGGFLYARTAEAAEAAEHVARQALAQLGLSEDCRLERWDPSSQEWQDVRSGLAAAEQAVPQGDRLVSVAGKVAKTIVGVVAEGFIQGN